MQENGNKNISKYKSFKQIVNTIYNEDFKEITKQDEIEKTKGIIIEPKLIYDRYNKSLKLEIRIGEKKLYKIKNLSEFYDNMFYSKKFKYGTHLEFIHTRDVFEEKYLPLLDFVLQQAESIKYVNSDLNPNYRYYGKSLNEDEILINNTTIDQLFNILKDTKVLFEIEREEKRVEFIDENPDIKFKIDKSSENDYKLSIETKNRLTSIPIFEGKEAVYVLKDDTLCKCSKEFEKTTLKIFKQFKDNYIEEVYISKEQLPELFSVILPKIKNNIVIKEKVRSEIEEYKPQKLNVKVYLSMDKHGYILADVKFCYGEEEFNPLDENIKTKVKRNSIEETKAFNIFGKTGFMMYEEKKQFILPQDDKIYEFLTTDIFEYMQRFDVLITDELKAKQIREPKIGSLGVRIENNLLSIDFAQINISLSELQDIMEKYTLKKKFYRLKDGSFLSLENNKDLEFIDKIITGMDINYKELEKGQIRVPVNRSLYLNSLLSEIPNTQILKNDDYRKIVNGLKQDNVDEQIIIPENFENVLRYYQKTGFKWLKILDKYKFGGILADDMGLGKTIQILCVLMDYVRNTSNKEKRTSIVICPSSIALNWKSEANKFAEFLKVQVISGNAKERENQINELEKYDLIITSYDLLKRDIEVYTKKNYFFRYVIADEAQYLKNSNTQNAKAIKEINAETRYALTGTPIENSLAELWSIFDFIMPGYLFSYKKFKNAFEIPIVKENSKFAMEKIKMLIEPFVLRRTKKEVLTELPDKSVTILNNAMNEEQEKIYLSYLAQTKKEIINLIDTDMISKNNIQILAALTRLRQICCHPSLFISDYKGGSSKLEQCIEIIQEATQSGHKVLLFSGYTSMLEIIEKEIKEKGIKYFKLTGSTKVDDRLDLVDEFNANEEVKVFLISLKAGGTGLNLTGADVVIHYDPWWNSSAENQATDRAYRMGQKHNVQVYKLITKNSIEEKIYELQNKKSELIDNVLDTQTTFINQFSKEEIMKLFE